MQSFNEAVVLLLFTLLQLVNSNLTSEPGIVITTAGTAGGQQAFLATGLAEIPAIPVTVQYYAPTASASAAAVQQNLPDVIALATTTWTIAVNVELVKSQLEASIDLDYANGTGPKYPETDDRDWDVCAIIFSLPSTLGQQADVGNGSCEAVFGQACYHALFDTMATQYANLSTDCQSSRNLTVPTACQSVFGPDYGTKLWSM
jgi:hypothetical protein